MFIVHLYYMVNMSPACTYYIPPLYTTQPITLLITSMMTFQYYLCVTIVIIYLYYLVKCNINNYRSLRTDLKHNFEIIIQQPIELYVSNLLC